VISLLVLILCFASPYSSSSQTSQASFQTANNAILSAYSQVRTIAHDRGNATIFVAKLNLAINLYNKAQGENASDPSQALSDLQNATQIANSVQNEAAPIARQLETQRQNENYLEIGGSVAVVVAATLVYFYGGALYDWIWLYQRRDSFIVVVTKKENGR
jgi:hypothetical protein